ncbi:right-handed parallel beta-helix repeat-containing protein [Streptomyces sp. MB09-01]|uniref:right-handed parallel beta-helix repeat-containing protein n=1 Tax=Streptomyces sp. MB09-01 TaxID=3028666 RepID=UPI0029A17BA6|nr:right-handed parallel beta-helix repeat-containing protein [Streptomyces sp. MB09-01]MDX3539977.1 right-handed parallel beta-helix repeat-containing protein [Streptomyces sp. MB09-01]
MKHTRTLALTTALLASSAPLGLATVGAGTAHAAARTYFVSPSGNDSNSGTSTGAPFRTLQKAADSVGPGDTVSIMNGTYSERSEGSNVLTIKRSGLPGAPITFTAHPGHHPVIHPVKAWNGISVHGASYISIKNLEIKGNNAALTLAGAERESKKGDPTYNTNCVSVEKDRSTGALSHHVEVTGNEVHGCAGGGISAIDSDHVTISGNHVFGTSWYAVYATSGISVLTPRDVGGGDAGTYKIRITGNRVHDNETKIKWEKCGCYSDGNGIIIDTLKGDADHPAYSGRVLVANNLAYDNGGSGIHSYRSQHVDIVHNTAYANGRSTRMDSYANIFAHDSTDVRLLNNIAYGRPGQATNSKSRNVDVTYDYNIYFGGKAPEVKGPNDVIADPKFVRAGTGAEADFRLSEGSPAAGSGAPFAAVTTDFTGARRPGGAPDRGAYGFGAKSSGVAGNASGVTSPGRQGDATAGSGQSAGSDPAGSPGVQAGDGTDGGSGLKPHSASGPLAETGGFSPVLPLGIAAVVLALGGGLLFVARRKRS